MVLHAPIEVSADALCAVVARENLGEMHYALAAQPMWRDEDATREYQAKAASELVGLGLAGRGGLDPDFRDTLITLTHPAHEFLALFVVDNEVRNVVAAAGAGDGVLAIRDGDTVSLQPARRTLLAEAAVFQLPQVRAAHGRGVNVPEHDLAERPRRHRRDDGYDGLRPAQENPDVAHLRRILDQPTIGGGQLFAGVRDQGGRLRSSPHPLSYLDTEDGRWMNHVSVTRTGERWVVAAPAGPELLVRRLYEMQRELG